MPDFEYVFKDSKTLILKNTTNNTISVDIKSYDCSEGDFKQLAIETIPPNSEVSLSFKTDTILKFNDNFIIKWGFISISEYLYLYSEYVCGCSYDEDKNIPFDALARMVILANAVTDMYDIKLRVDNCLLGYSDCREVDIKSWLTYHFKVFYGIYKSYMPDNLKNFFPEKNYKCCIKSYLPANFSEDYANINIAIQDNTINLPPDSIGDGNLVVSPGNTVVLNRYLFLNNYHDPEGDPPYAIKILSLPEYGVLLFKNYPVNIGDVILFTDIDSGFLTYTSSTTITNDGFMFTVSDEGSRNFYEI